MKITVLQQDINAIAMWIADNHLQFNTSKCKYMTISRKRAKELPPTINLNGIPLDRVTEFKYLGILITADLSWTVHINMICTKARRLVGMLYRQFYQDADTSTHNDSVIQSLHNTVNDTKWLHYISPFSGYCSYSLFTVLPSLGLVVQEVVVHDCFVVVQMIGSVGRSGHFQMIHFHLRNSLPERRGTE